MLMIDALVIHNQYGRGRVTAFDGQLITVDFADQPEKKMRLSLVLTRGILRFVDEDRQTQALQKFAEPEPPERSIKLPSRAVTKRTSTKHRRTGRPVPTETTSPARLIVGDTYSNQEIMATFLVAPYGGMRRSNRKNALVLISRHHDDMAQNPYEDRWQSDGFFHYTGMGRIGDQSLESTQNRTLNESGSNGVNVYLFESSVDNEYVYRGEVRLAAPPYSVQERDSGGQLRRVYKFPLALIR
ncbi:hypothetical protein [Lacticaseibacillus absianus]|uniref:hypothetical protein n=1 Tax=Lacticaseibacillus absianus TaxID=2729623 RepID=UPI0015C80163|nr:hypothetical protein [Lacticaseibacillus absianus]